MNMYMILLEAYSHLYELSTQSTCIVWTFLRDKMVGFDINKNYAIYYGKNNFSQKCDYYVESKTKKHDHVAILNSTVYIHHLLCSKSIEQ